MNQKLVVQSVINNLASFSQLWPEVLIAVTLVSVVVLAILLPQYQRYWLSPVAFLGTLLAGYHKYQLIKHAALTPTRPLFNHLLLLDPLAIFFCLLLIGITLFMLLLHAHRSSPTPGNRHDPAYVVLILGILLSSCLLVMAFHWITIYLGLTLLSLTSALLIGSHKTARSVKASLQYLLYSIATTALMLWGVAYFYGFTEILTLSHPGLGLSLQTPPAYLVLVSILLCLSNLLWISATVPYHFCIPDIYQGTPPATVAYLSTIPKLTAVAVLLRISQQLWPQLPYLLQEYAQHGMAVLALLTITVGNAAALQQKNLQRLMAYGSIAQGGWLLAGVAASTSSPTGVLYYSAVYGIMGFAIWIGVKILQEWTGSVYLQECMGLGRRSPLLGSSITIVVLALIGLPPTAGFTGKFLLLTALWGHMQSTGSSVFLVLLVASLVGTVLSLYYYLKLPYILFCKTAQKSVDLPSMNQSHKMVLCGLAILLLIGFFTASSLLEVISDWLSCDYNSRC